MPDQPAQSAAAACRPAHDPPTDDQSSKQLRAEVERRLGVLPNFFRLASEDPNTARNLWGFACQAYLDNPLPSLFKERLFVYLSRFCDVRYCIVRHLGFLTGLGHPAGDPHAQVQTIDQALRLIRRALPREEQVEARIERCAACAAPLADLPPPDSEMDEAIFTCATHVFLQNPEAPRCLAALERVLGATRLEHLKVFLTFVQTAHYWTRLHPELPFEDDVSELMATHHALAEHLLNDPEAGTCRISRKLMEELATLREEKQQRDDQSQEAVEARDRLRQINSELAARVAEARDARRAALNLMEDAIAAKEALTEADRRKDEFLATLAHELRNPLAPIRSSVQIMRLADVDSEVTEQARSTIERQVNHMVRLVDDLLDVSRISSNKLKLRKERVALGVIVRSAVETTRPLIEASGQELIVDVPRQAIWLDADLTRMAQAVANLLNNASKFTPEGGRVTLTAERQGHQAVVTVRDTGVGMPSDVLPHIFEMFRQAGAHEDRTHDGMGIGLTLVKSLVEMHGGTVEAGSEGIGKGSEFRLSLPLAERMQSHHAHEDGPGPATVAPRRVLVVDDNRDAADSLALLLAQAGHDTQKAHDGLEALTAAAAFRPDVILLDIGMPKLNGYEVARQLRELDWGRDVLLVALTGWGQEEDRLKSRQAGFDGHIVKPVAYEELAKLLAELQVATSETSAN